MKRIFLYTCALVVFGLFLAALSSCVPNGPGSPYISTPPQMTPATIERAMATWFPATLTPTPAEGPERINFLALGGDMGPGRPQLAPGGAGDKTDVMLLVSILRTDPAQITIVQFPRNLWVPQYRDQLLFEVYWQDGFEGIHSYFYDVFGITLQGVAYVDMPTFVKYVDDIGGVNIAGEPWMDGADLLAWLRDNDNNWKHGVYDVGMRQARALVAILDSVYKEFSAKDFLVAWRFFSKVETDLSALQFLDAAFVGYQSIQRGASVEFDRLAYPAIARGDIPIAPGRAEVATVDLREWMAEVLAVR
jgi:hypothetical protein